MLVRSSLKMMTAMTISCRNDGSLRGLQLRGTLITLKMMVDLLVPVLTTTHHHLGDDNYLTLIALTSTMSILPLFFVGTFLRHLEMI